MQQERVPVRKYAITCPVFLLFLTMASRALADYEQIQVRLSSCATSVSHQTAQTVRNIRLAVDKFSGKILEPGQVFSFNDAVGRITPVEGYQPAPTFIDGKRDDVTGGGICQVSSTLYCAALQAGLTIIERHKHSFPVTYLPVGLDATIAYGQKDLRFKNTSGQTLVIKGEIVGGRLVISFYGEREPEHTYELVSEINEIPPPETDRKLMPALEALVYRLEMKNNEVISKQFLYRDYYPCRINNNTPSEE
jgi:vancomycin resistance protein YoaR